MERLLRDGGLVNLWEGLLRPSIVAKELSSKLCHSYVRVEEMNRNSFLPFFFFFFTDRAESEFRKGLNEFFDPIEYNSITYATATLVAQYSSTYKIATEHFNKTTSSASPKKRETALEQLQSSASMSCHCINLVFHY
jgi:hypothetical protein